LVSKAALKTKETKFSYTKCIFIIKIFRPHGACIFIIKIYRPRGQSPPNSLLDIPLNSKTQKDKTYPNDSEFTSGYGTGSGYQRQL
jgi:hypothetical protein